MFMLIFFFFQCTFLFSKIKSYQMIFLVKKFTESLNLTPTNRICIGYIKTRGLYENSQKVGLHTYKIMICTFIYKVKTNTAVLI